MNDNKNQMASTSHPDLPQVSSTMPTDEGSKVYTNMQEYCDALKQYIQCSMWHLYWQQQAAFSHYLYQSPKISDVKISSTTTSSAEPGQSSTNKAFSLNAIEVQAKRLAQEHLARQQLNIERPTAGNPSRSSSHSAARQNRVPQDPDMPIQGARFDLAKPWRRLLAEFIDYLVLMIIKIFFFMVVNQEWNILNLLMKVDLDFRMFSPRYGIFQEQSLFFDDTPVDVQGDGTLGNSPDMTPFDFITPEVLLAELLNRFFITFYESFMIAQCGATFGKMIMGLQVVSCQDVIDLPEGRVEAIPGGRCTFVAAAVRSAIKNCAVIFCFPVCLTTLFFQHYRATYDMIASTMVVQRPPRRRRT